MNVALFPAFVNELPAIRCPGRKPSETNDPAARLKVLVVSTDNEVAPVVTVECAMAPGPLWKSPVSTVLSVSWVLVVTELLVLIRR